MSNAQTVLITGASSGIGLELANICAEHGHNVVLIARSKQRLEAVSSHLLETYDVQASIFPQDLSELDASAKVEAYLRKSKITIDILINNAGFGGREAFAQADIEHDLGMIAVNITALTELTARLLPGMVERKKGRILNVASLAALVPGPYMAVYHASKAYVLSFSQAIAAELTDTGVTVTALCPGATKTSWAQHAGLGANSSFDGRAMKATDVARKGYNAMMSGKLIAFASPAHHAAASVVGFVPLSLRNHLAHWQKEAPK